MEVETIWNGDYLTNGNSIEMEMEITPEMVIIINGNYKVSNGIERRTIPLIHVQIRSDQNEA